MKHEELEPGCIVSAKTADGCFLTSVISSNEHGVKLKTGHVVQRGDAVCCDNFIALTLIESILK